MARILDRERRARILGQSRWRWPRPLWPPDLW
jgi:hypothetical protein